MRWFMVLPVLCAALVAAYLSSLAQQQIYSIILFLMGITVCLVCWFSFDWWIALTATLPLYHGYLSVRTHFAETTPATS
jgi:preprotein translocase subunit SecF